MIEGGKGVVESVSIHSYTKDSYVSIIRTAMNVAQMHPPSKGDYFVRSKPQRQIISSLVPFSLLACTIAWARSWY